jgi:hypothetical protein
MLESVMGRKLFSLAESSHLRIEAMQLFEQSLTNGDASVMIAFIERQLANDPPRIQLLREIADDLQQRLLSLREYHFDVRERVVSTLSESYDVDISPLAPAAMLDQYHLLALDDVCDLIQESNPTLTDNDVAILRKMIDASLHIAAQLHEDIQITHELYDLILDWIEALGAMMARQHWNAQTGVQQNQTEKDLYH